MYDLKEKVLILSDRRDHLDEMLKWCNKNVCPSGLWLGYET